MDKVLLEHIDTFLNGKGRCFVSLSRTKQLPDELIDYYIDRYDYCILVKEDVISSILVANGRVPVYTGYEMIKELTKGESNFVNTCNSENTLFIFDNIDKVDFGYIDIIKIFRDMKCPKAKYLFCGESVYNINKPEDMPIERFMMDYNMYWLLAETRSVTL